MVPALAGALGVVLHRPAGAAGQADGARVWELRGVELVARDDEAHIDARPDAYPLVSRLSLGQRGTLWRRRCLLPARTPLGGTAGTAGRVGDVAGVGGAGGVEGGSMENRLAQSEALPFLQSLPAASVDLICTDPPYNIGKAAWDSWPSDAAYLTWLREHLLAMRQVLKPNGSLYLFAAPQLAARVEVVISEVFHVLNHLVWVKSTGNANWKADKEAIRSFLPNTERIIFAEHPAQSPAYEASCNSLRASVFESLRLYLASEWKRAGLTPEEANTACGTASMAGRHYFTRSQWCLPTAEHYASLQRYANSRNGHTDYLRQEYEDLRQEYEDLRRPFALTAQDPYTDVWTFRPVLPEPGKHPCEKPLPLLRHIVRTSSRPGAVVLDCFCGSGSTLDAARQENRSWLGCDVDAHWIAQAQRRLQAPYTLSLFADTRREE